MASPYLYGGTYNSFRITLRNLGIECRIAEDDSNESIEKLIDQNTKLIYLESMGNPTCDVVDIEESVRLPSIMTYHSSLTIPLADADICATRLIGERISYWNRQPNG